MQGLIFQLHFFSLVHVLYCFKLDYRAFYNLDGKSGVKINIYYSVFPRVKKIKSKWSPATTTRRVLAPPTAPSLDSSACPPEIADFAGDSD